jgi:peptide chain release factor subunit 1
VKQHKLRKVIACISEQKGRGIEFISLYIPHETPVDEVVAALKKELDCAPTASQSVREVKNRLEDATKNIVQYLKLQKEIPNDGLAIFAGTFTSDLENNVLTIEEIIPPEPITTFLYQVDDHFHLELLREMLRNQKDVGFVALDSKEASFGIIKGEQFELIENITSGVHGKSGKGGSSQRRYERERDMAVSNFFHRVADHAAKAFLQDHKIAALIVGGPGTTKEDFLKGDYLNYELQNSVVSVVDTQSAGKDGVREMLDKSAEVRQSMCAPDERRIVQRLMTTVGKQDGLAIYGLAPVLEAVKKGEVEVALVTDTTDMLETVVVCKKCGLPKTQIVTSADKVHAVQEMISSPCESCKAIEYEVEEKDIIDVLEDAASQTNARVEVISTDSKEKSQLTALGGFAALLRYKKSENALQ